MTAVDHPSYDPLLSSVDAASYLGLHPETLRKMTRQREIDCVRRSKKQGSDIRYKLSALNKWANRNEVKAMRGR